ncbi:transcriptional regulator with XRE-family HTH domain [Pseudomonas sp. JAI115]|uniref:helix-turn-helix domain-containing protein n=1 Tax=Pseudomonas sp. JAI115 TaxID=2723061 RepID=UPI00160C8EC0|nr:helix-turn-helix domain-containing protein [Pseudomonas sp. JAI115]MBB6158537.1 transcriptional regulator with XRE-family HTH domain [Pseudomonas sp. JAI115]
MDAAEALAVVVRGIRIGQGLSQEDINNLGRSHFSRIERGEVSIGLDVLVRLAGILDLDPATLLLMATAMQNHESFKDAQKRVTKQLARIRKAGIDLEIESQARVGKPRPGRPVRPNAAINKFEANRLKQWGMSVVEIAERLGLSEATIRRYLKTTKPEQP